MQVNEKNVDTITLQDNLDVQANVKKEKIRKIKAKEDFNIEPERNTFYFIKKDIIIERQDIIDYILQSENKDKVEII